MKLKLLTLILLLFSFILYAEEKTFTTSDGVELYVQVKGEGYPLLYIHGGPGAGSHWFEKFFGEFMEEHLKVVYLDQRGVGRSSSPSDGNFSLDRMILDFEEVRKEFQFDQWFTLGHSFGGILQMSYAHRYPAVHKGMLMVNCTFDITESICQSWIPKAAELLDEEYIGCERDPIPPLQRFNEYGGRLRSENIFWKMAYRDEKSESLMDSVMEEIKNHNYDFSNAVMKLEEYFGNFKPLAAELQFPVLYFYGEKDWMIGPEHFKNLNFPNLLLWNNKGGHIPFIEEREDLQNAILKYMSTNNF